MSFNTVFPVFSSFNDWTVLPNHPAGYILPSSFDYGLDTKPGLGQFNETQADAFSERRMGALLVPNIFSSFWFSQKNIMCRAIFLGTRKVVLNKINNGVCVLGKEEEERGREKTKHTTGGRCYGEKKATWINAYGVLQFKAA